MMFTRIWSVSAFIGLVFQYGVVFVLLLWVAPCQGAQVDPPVVSLPFMQHVPTIDGTIDETEWEEATRIVGFVSQHDLRLTDREGVFWFGCDGKNLYVAIQTELPPTGALLTRATPDPDRDQFAVVYDDNIELWIDPHKGRTQGDRRYFQMIVNERQALFDRSYDPARSDNPVSMAWRVHWQFATQKIAGRWHVEIAIPLASLDAEQDLTHPWGLRVVRNWQRPSDQSRWESIKTAFDDQVSMPVVSWDATAPVIQMLSLHEGHERPTIALRVRNPHAQPLVVHIAESDAWSSNLPVELNQTVTVAPHSAEIVTLHAPDNGPEGVHNTILRVTSADEKHLYFFRDVRWTLQRTEPLWVLEKEAQRLVELPFKYYPYYRKIKARIDATSLSEPKAVTEAHLTVHPKGAREVLAQAHLPVNAGAGETIFDVPDLRDGEYDLTAGLTGDGAVPAEPIVRTFERTHFPWEHNMLGLSQVVIPPFTPLEVNGNIVDCILRQYHENQAGLWDQILSKETPVLTAPMRWEVRSGGVSQTVASQQQRVVSRQPWQVISEARWEAPGVSAHVLHEYDYDGMVKVTLTLSPPLDRPVEKPDQQVEQLTLTIPISAHVARYLHAVGDGLRHNFAGAIPQGEGKIWDSSQENTVNIVGTFYPYLWVGDGERGLSWFADSDKDWELDDTTPTLVLERRDNTLLLQVHFITKPVTLSRPHRIVFGIQATPVKPMPEQPSNWRKWQFGKDLISGMSVRILGSGYYYGTLSFDLYPRDGDLSIYDWIAGARRSGKADGEFLKRWLEGYPPSAEPDGKQQKVYEDSIRYTAHVAPLAPMDGTHFLIPYTNPRGIGFHAKEWPTFQDEWVNFPYYARKRKGGLAYDITPTRSFQDVALWYYREMLRCFDGVYWDNVYLSANWDTVTGDAWIDEKGRTHPSMGLFALRELIKRTAVLFHEMGRPGILIPHMTNTNIVPVLAFANVTLDWEWHYGQQDFQDRFTPELTVAETIGRQTGATPLILSGGFYDATAPNWRQVMRTRLGVALVHEIRIWDDARPDFEVELLRKLYEFGYGEKDCVVYNYWEDGQPVQVSGVNAKTLVLSRAGRVVFIVTDYGGGGRCQVRLDREALNLPTTLQATDLETGEHIDLANEGILRFPLKQHDFKAILITPLR